jgi:hypothetical protein
MRIIITLLVLLTISIQTQAQKTSKKIKGDGNQTTTTRNVSDFEKIGVSGSFDVELIKGNEGEITIKADANLIEYIVTEVKKGKLHIKTKKGHQIKSSHKIKITVTFESLNAIAMAGSGNIHSSNIIESNELKLSLAGSGDMKLNVDTGDLKSSIAGSGNIILSGNSDELSCSIAGSGNVKGYDLKANKTSVSIAGSGNVEVNAIEEIHAKIAGSGNVYYSGNPSVKKSNSAGSGSIRKKG